MSISKLCVAAAVVLAGSVAARDDGSLRGEAAALQPAREPDAWEAQRDALAAKAAAYLRSKQDPASGGWNKNPSGPTFPAITGLVLQGLLKQGVDERDPSVASGVRFILASQQRDGGFYDTILPSYNTAICLTALAMVKDQSPEVKAAIQRAQQYLKGLQYGEDAAISEGAVDGAARVSRDHPYYGGWGYGRHGRPDLSNSAFAVEALRLSGVSENDPAFQRALVFLQRCQMAESGADGAMINDAPYAKGSTQGGFIYATSENKDKVGSGQSFAGEIAESLSGPPGVVAHVVLKSRGEDGKPVALTRAQILDRIRQRAESSPDPELAGLAERCLVLFGPGSTDVANAFDIRAGVTGTRRFESLIGSAFADASDTPIRVEAVAHWQGESRLRAYGSMTYSGFKSYMYAGLSRTDPRVRLAREWISRNYTVEENPGVGTDGLYYYFVVFSRALRAYGEPTVRVVAPDGTSAARDWRRDIVERLSSLQLPDGSFRSVDDRWMETDPVLISAYALIALRHAE